MTTTRLLPPESLIILLSLTLLSVDTALSADREVITDDGREVLLKEDGTWEFRSTDRFANTEDGHRVRLKEDGSWQYMGNAPMVSKQQVKTTLLDIELQKVVVETHEQKVQKNTRVKSQTVFYLNLALSPLATSNLDLNKDAISLISVTDSDSRNYPVLSLQPGTASLPPDAETTIVVRVDGSPQWWKKVKWIEIEFKPDIFGIDKPVALSKRADDIDKKKVDGFEESE